MSLDAIRHSPEITLVPISHPECEPKKIASADLFRNKALRRHLIDKNDNAVDGFVGNRDYSLRYTNSLASRTWHAFGRFLTYLASFFIDIYGYKKNVTIQNFQRIQPDLLDQIEGARNLIESPDRELRKQGLKVFKKLVLLKAKIELSDLHQWLYDGSLNKKISDLEAQIAHSSFASLVDAEKIKLTQNLEQLKAQAKIKHHGYKSRAYMEFVTSLQSLETAIKSSIATTPLLDPSKLDPNAYRNPEEEKLYQLYRWVNSCDLQRKLAAFCPTHQLPYRCEEVPKGAVLMTNGDLYLSSKTIRGIFTSFSDWFRIFKANINQAAIGSRALHAELSLGGGKIIHQEKDPNNSLGGITEILDRSTRRDKFGRPIPYVLTHDVVLPNPQAFFKTDTPEQAHKKLQQRIEIMTHNCASNRYNVITTFKSMLRSGWGNFVNYRTADYEAISPLRNHDALRPHDTLDLSCSATVASIYADYDLDITEGTTKTLEVIDPADFGRSEFFNFAFRSGAL